MTTDNIIDLDWLAFSYAAGELNPTEAEQFELAADLRDRIKVLE